MFLVNMSLIVEKSFLCKS